MSERNDKVIQFKKKKKGMFAGVIAAVVAIVLLILFTCFHINDIEVTGNRHYNKEQIKNFVLENGYVDNTVLYAQGDSDDESEIKEIIDEFDY